MGRNETKPLAQQAARVLLVEDIVLNQVVLQAQLEESGYHVTLAMNGAQALDRVRAEHFDLVLMDLQMPVMDGYESAARIRDELGIHNAVLPIIAITSHPEHTVLKKCLEAGMDDCLTKPIRSSDLNQTIREWLGQSENDPGFPATSRNNTAQEIPAVLDENQIHETILYIGNDSLVDMFENFKRDIGLQIESLDSGKSLSIAELHHLGTSSSYMGLWRIKQLCDAMITYLSAENNKSATPDLAAELKDEFHIGLNALNDYMFKSGLLQ